MPDLVIDQQHAIGFAAGRSKLIFVYFSEQLALIKLHRPFQVTADLRPSDVQHADLQAAALIDAVVDAGAVRFRPMLLTAAAVIVGSSVILFDPIFQGLAISLMAGEVASLLLSRMAVPVLYYLSKRNEVRPDQVTGTVA